MNSLRPDGWKGLEDVACVGVKGGAVVEAAAVSCADGTVKGLAFEEENGMN